MLVVVLDGPLEGLLIVLGNGDGLGVSHAGSNSGERRARGTELVTVASRRGGTTLGGESGMDGGHFCLEDSTV